MIITAISLGIVVVFAIVAYFFAKSGADKGLMSKMPADAFPACYDLEGVRPDVVVEFLRAVDWWHGQVGDEFIVDDETSGLKIFVNTVDDAGDDYYARAKFVDDKPAVLLLINLAQVARKPERLFRAMCHELGHFLGLAHDDDPESIMYGRTVEGEFRLTDKDRDLVRGRIWRG